MTIAATRVGSLGGTYAGNPLAVAAALETMRVIEDEGLVARARMLGERLTACLAALRTEVPRICDVRGLGAMVAVEFRDPHSGEPDAEFTKRVHAAGLERGLLLLTCGVHGNVVRFLFPLTIPEAVFEEGLGLLAESIRAANV